MEVRDFDANAELKSFQFMPESILKKLFEYHIQTIGQLLSATKGFTKADLLFASDEEKEVLSMLAEIVPADIKKEHESFSTTYPTGLITRNQDDHEEESNKGD